MKCYETMFILKPTLVESEIKSRIEFFKEVISKNGGLIRTCFDMGMRNLAYEIKKHRRGYYFVIYFESEPSLIAEIERNYRISEDILRFIVIKYESKKEQKAWQTLIERANAGVTTSKLKKDEMSVGAKKGDSRTNDENNEVAKESINIGQKAEMTQP